MNADMKSVRLCDGVDVFRSDDGWVAGLHCFVSRGHTWSRCERSNRECEYYRHVARRNRQDVSRCGPAEQAWAIRRGPDHVNPAPSPEECERIRRELVARGDLAADAVCERATYDDLLKGPRKRTIAEPSAR